MEPLSVVGHRVPNYDGVVKATGIAVYGVDLEFPNMLVGRLLRSPYAHARVLHVDPSRARRLPGVKAVVTGQDYLDTYYGFAIRDQRFYAVDKVRYVGEPVAAVAAIDEDAAREACELIRVEYEPLPAVLDPEAALAPGAPVIHERLGEYGRQYAFHPVPGTNICHHLKVRRGDIEQGWREADEIFEDTFSTQRVEHCCIEPNTVVAQLDPTGRITVWGSTHTPDLSRIKLADALGLPMSRVRVIPSYLGGGFGGKHFQVIPETVGLALQCGGRPVKLQYTREEVFSTTSTRAPVKTTIKTGVKRDGTIVAREVRSLWDSGAYAERGPSVTRNAGYAAAGPYRIPQVKIDAYCMYTNKLVAGAFRGFGIPQVAWPHEMQMDVIAGRLGLDPVEIRLRNLVEEGDVSATGELLHSVGVKESLIKAAAAIGWGKPKPRGRGRGIACMQKTAPSFSSSAAVKVNPDGTVELLTTAVDCGQGSNTVLAQILAEELGVPLSAVHVAPPDTEVTPFDWGTAGSRTTFMVGNAVRAAAQDAKRQILDLAAEMFECSPEDLVAREGWIHVKGSPDRKTPLAKVPMGFDYHKGVGKGRVVVGRGEFTSDTTGIDPETGQGPKPTPFWMYASQAAEVQVDEETGYVRVLHLSAAHDVGKAINPLACEGQIEGAIAMGVGYGLTEHLVVDEKGVVVNPTLTNYLIPTVLEMPEVTPIIIEAPHREGPFGAKGLGEPGLAPTAPAIANAIYDAVGVRIHDLPITPEKVLKALQEKKAREGAW